MEEYSDANKLTVPEEKLSEENIDDVIRLYMPPKRVRKYRSLSFLFRICRFFALVIAFFFIYYCLYQLYVKNALAEEDIPASALPTETSVSQTTANLENIDQPIPFVIDESGIGINIEEYLDEEEIIKFPRGDGVKVIIVNSHSSERVSSSLSVTAIAEDLKKILESRGIGVYFDAAQNDTEGMIGAYSRMSERITKLKATYNEAVVVIDLHDSDSGTPLTFTVGTSESFAWQENLRLACNIYKIMKEAETAFRFFPTSLGQDTGLLTLNVGIGGSQTDDRSARASIAALADALAQILSQH